MSDEKITAAQLKEKILFITEQTRTAAALSSVKCECKKDIPLMLSYRCLYCGQWYCRKCAEVHFGKTLAQYRKENLLPDVDLFDLLDQVTGAEL